MVAPAAAAAAAAALLLPASSVATTAAAFGSPRRCTRGRRLHPYGWQSSGVPPAFQAGASPADADGNGQGGGQGGGGNGGPSSSSDGSQLLDLDLDPRYEYDSAGRPVDAPVRGRPAFDLQTPHSGRHFFPSHPSSSSSSSSGWVRSRLWRRFRKKRRRFTEGWYYRLTLPDPIGESFVFIFSIEDPWGSTWRRGKQPSNNLTLACMQVMGPDDEYLVQSDRDDGKFWAWRYSQAFGCAFTWKDDDDDDGGDPSRADADGTYDRGQIAAMTPEEWRRRVETGFQVLPFSIQGRLVGHDGTRGGVGQGQGVPGNCTFDLAIDPIAGWGDATGGGGGGGEGGGGDASAGGRRQRSTAGWLASLPAFEPHWQVTLADARASGTVAWKNRTYAVTDAPFYAEKNWGGSFPTRWYWTQCNSFVDHPNLSVVAGGGTRKLPLLGGRTEDLGLVGVHHDGTFYEAVPWTGDVTWRVEPWGRWELRGRCTDRTRPFEVALVATCDEPGVKLRAPTEDEGMVYFARDSFYANVTLSLWDLVWDEEGGELVRKEPPVIDAARSSQGGVEVGGGPWWDVWAGKSRMRQPMKGMVKFPYVFRRARDRLGKVLRSKTRRKAS